MKEKRGTDSPLVQIAPGGVSDRDPDPNLAYYRKALMEMQKSMSEQQRLVAILRRRATLHGIETIGRTTESEADESWS